MALPRLHLGCGEHAAAGWLNHDRTPGPGVDVVADLTRGLPLDDGSVGAAVGIHLLQDLAWPDIPPVLAEIRRVLAPGGWLRLALPDLERALDAFRRGDAGYFYIEDRDAASLGGKLVTQIIWYGSVRTPFTADFAAELLQRAGFGSITRCRFGETASGDATLASLDNRERESFFIEASAPVADRRLTA